MPLLLSYEILGALATLRSLPIDILGGHFDITRLAMNAAKGWSTISGLNIEVTYFCALI
jgi:hypothetical protein